MSSDKATRISDSTRSTRPFDDFAEGKILIVVDDDDRENEGDFVCAAEFVDACVINFLRHARARDHLRSPHAGAGARRSGWT